MKTAGHKSSSDQLDLAAIREKLAGAHGPQYWRSLGELAETPEFREMVHREFPDGASEWFDGLSRRHFLKIAAASLALAGLTGCTKQPNREILPYVRQPERLVPGDALIYATAMPFNGYANGVLVSSREGHPIKVDANPQHPATPGGSDIWMQASILDLYDPDRSRTVTHGGEISSWMRCLDGLHELNQEHASDGGEGLRLLTETVTSPTFAAQWRKLQEKFPKAKWHQYEPVNSDHAREGARIAFGQAVVPQFQFSRADVIVSLESDFLSDHPQRLRYTREFADGRRVAQGHKKMSRLYVVESTPTVTGAMADHRFPMASGDIVNFAIALARELGLAAGSVNTSAPYSSGLSAIARDLKRSRGRSIIIAGESQPPVVQALAHWMNDALGNTGDTVFFTNSPEIAPVNQGSSLRELSDDMRAGKVRSLIIIGGNPVYSAPSDFRWSELLPQIKRSFHLGLEPNETAALCTWHVPQSHYLESWGDGRSYDGTVSLMQPLIGPLHGGKSPHEFLDVMLDPASARSDYDIVSGFWREQNRWPEFEKGWRRALHDGFIANTELEETSVQLNSEAVMAAVSSVTAKPADQSFEVVFRPDPAVWDGRFSNNGWLQECPRPINKLTWDNAVLVSPALAQRLELNNEDVVELTANGRAVRGPVWIQPGQAANTITLHLGYGRQRVGRVGAGTGFNVFPFRTSDSPWRVDGVQLRKTGARQPLVTTQIHHTIDSPDREVYRSGTLGQFQKDERFVKASVESPGGGPSLYASEFPREGNQWGMSIDLTTCIGCNACLMACNAENNIPVVGKREVGRHREMHWIRIDTYHKGPLDNPRFNHQPVPCMHCEHAPCELVCPVAATVHDHEGLNLQVYNRCVGTRFCSNNCPYKVRRFNFLSYAKYDAPELKLMLNPEVTVRWRGVMEKCTYCIQRISRARITAEKENRPIGGDEVTTACQQACPARAIVFGDLGAADSSVARLKQSPLDFSMLGPLNTRPRTTYLAKIRNPNPELEGQPVV